MTDDGKGAPGAADERSPVACGEKAPPAPRRRSYKRHGFYALKATLRELGPRVIDRRTTIGKQLAAWRADLVRDVGGDPSTQEAAIIDLAMRTKLLLESIDSWLLMQPNLIDTNKNALLPVVRERMQLSDSLARYMTLLGLERRAKPLDLAAQIAALHVAPPATDGEGT